jgi:hypothetical protein
MPEIAIACGKIEQEIICCIVSLANSAASAIRSRISENVSFISFDIGNLILNSNLSLKTYRMFSHLLVL